MRPARLIHRLRYFVTDAWDEWRHSPGVNLLASATLAAALFLGGGKQKELSIEVPEIRLENVGSESSGGVQLTELTRILTTAVLEAVASQGGKLPSGLAGDLTGRLRELPKVDVKLPKSADDLKGLSDSGSGVVEEGKKAVEGLKGLFDRD